MDLHVSLVGRGDVTGQIYAQIRAAILAGWLRPGDRLPATRELADRLAVSRTTVTVAYDRLTGEGFLRARVGAGTFVSDDVAIAVTDNSPPVGTLRPRVGWHGITVPRPTSPAAFDLRCGLPDARLFPYESWRRLTARQLRPSVVGRGRYGEPAGHPALRAAVARHIGVARAVRATAGDIIITNGIQQAVDLVARVLLAPGDRIAVEDPGYPPARSQLQGFGADVVGVPVDNEGLVVDAIPDRTRLIHVTPSHQFPLGVAMSLRRRVALLRWANDHDAAIFEDDYDSEFRFGGRPIEPLQSLDTSGRVLYAGSFSKTMLPALRLGFVVTPPSLREALCAAKYTADWATTEPSQRALATFIDEGGFARHVRKMRAVYHRRHELLTSTVSRDFAGLLQVLPSSAGLHVSALAPRHSPRAATDAIRRAAANGVAAYSLASFAATEPPRAGVVLGYGAIAVENIPEGLRRIRASFDP